MTQANSAHLVTIFNIALNISEQENHSQLCGTTDFSNSEHDNDTALYGAVIYDESYMITFLKLYFAPFLLFTGSLGNIMSFVVFSRATLKHSATAFYFRMLACADTLALNVGLWPNWMRDAFDIHIYAITDASCRIQTYLRYMLPDCAVWMLVILTLERMVGIQWPHHARDIFTRRRTRISVLIMVLVIGIVNIPAIWTSTKSNGNTYGQPCIAAHMVLAYDIWPWVDLTVYSLLPFLIMTISIIVMLKTIKRRRRTLCRQGSINNDSRRTIQSMTVALLIIVFVFLFLTAPFVIYALIVKELNGKTNIDFLLFYYVASYLRYVNNSVNFFLYCLSGRTFRTELKHLLLGGRRRLSSSGIDSTYIAAGRGALRSSGISAISCKGKDTIISHKGTLPGSPAKPPVSLQFKLPIYSWLDT